MSTDTAVALPSDSRPPNLRQQIATMEHQFALAAPRGVEASQLVRDALTCLQQTPKLADCEPKSVLGALMTMAQLGLRPGVLGHGWVLPFWDSRMKWRDPSGRERTGGHKAQLIIGYQGMVELAYRSDRIAKITMRTVRANDHFDLEYGTNERLVHRPSTGERGDPTGYYATVKVKGGEAAFFYMTHAEMETYRDRYATAKTKEGKIVGPWRDNFEGMAWKTCIRQLAKLMPKSTELSVAMAVDESVRVNIAPDADLLAVSERQSLDAAPDTPRLAGDVLTGAVVDDERDAQDTEPGEAS